MFAANWPMKVERAPAPDDAANHSRTELRYRPELPAPPVRRLPPRGDPADRRPSHGGRGTRRGEVVRERRSASRDRPRHDPRGRRAGWSDRAQPGPRREVAAGEGAADAVPRGLGGRDARRGPPGALPPHGPLRSVRRPAVGRARRPWPWTTWT